MHSEKLDPIHVASPELHSLDREIKHAHVIIGALVTIIMAAYIVWFGLRQAQVISDQTATWGHFGSFAGGLLGPLVAYAAFYWLTKSVRLQKKELLDTRKALENTAKSQAEHATYALISVRVNALTALVNSIMVEVQTQRMQLQFVIDQMARGGHATPRARLIDGSHMQGRALSDHIASINENIEQRMTERSEYENEIKELLKKYDQASDLQPG